MRMNREERKRERDGGWGKKERGWDSGKRRGC